MTVCGKCEAEVNGPGSEELTDAAEQLELGYKYYNGEGVPQDYEKAVYWYAKAAEQGSVQAQINIASCYENGEGAPQDYEKAAFWYTKAAEQGHERAQCTLGFFYQMGQGVPQDNEKAVFWFGKAAEQGNDLALRNLKLLVEMANWPDTAEQGNAEEQAMLFAAKALKILFE